MQFRIAAEKLQGSIKFNHIQSTLLSLSIIIYKMRGIRLGAVTFKYATDLDALLWINQKLI